MGYFKCVRMGMMGKVALTVLFSGLLLCCGYSQSLAEFTKQKQLQTQYKLNQILALKAYSEVAKQGYQIAGMGWEMVRGIQNGEFSVHREYFGSLSQVHPLISEFPGPGNVMQVYRQISQQIDWMKLFLNRSIHLVGSELGGVNRFNQEVLLKADLILQELEAVLATNQYEMKDGERISAVVGSEEAMLGLFEGVKLYHEKVRFLEYSRSHRQNQLERLKNLYNVR